jgi:hypothetical protein
LHAVPIDVPAFGIEIDAELAAVAERDTGRAVIAGDFLRVTMPDDAQVTAIVGNPPFANRTIVRFLERAHALLVTQRPSRFHHPRSPVLLRECSHELGQPVVYPIRDPFAFHLSALDHAARVGGIAEGRTANSRGVRHLRGDRCHRRHSS